MSNPGYGNKRLLLSLHLGSAFFRRSGHAGNTLHRLEWLVGTLCLPFSLQRQGDQDSQSSAHVNFFAGLPLNRLAWLRTSNSFLNAVVTSPQARWVLYKDGNLLMESDDQSSGRLTLSRLTFHDVEPLLGTAPYFAQGQNPGDLAENDVRALQSARIHGPPIAFLGLLEPDTGGKIGNILPSSQFSAKADPASIAARIEGSPFFSLDVTKLDQGEVEKVLKESSIVKAGKTFEFVDGRAAMGHLTQVDSAIFAESRTLVDWNSRTRVCIVYE